MSEVETLASECAFAKICLKLSGQDDDEVKQHVHVSWVWAEGRVDVGVDRLRGIIKSVLWPYAPSIRVGIFGKQVTAFLDGDVVEARDSVAKRLEKMGYQSVDVT